MKKIAILLLVVVAVIGGGAWLLNNKSQRHGHEMPPALLPVVVEARLLSVGHTRLTLPVVADVQAVRESVVASRLFAYVTALPLFEGERFKHGALLARLDMTSSDPGKGQTNSLNTELAAADSNLKTEQERLRRVQALYQIQGVSLEQVQAAESVVATARSRQMLARENLRGATVTAPFDGVVSQRLAQPGDLVTPGKPLLKITDTSSGVRLLVNVPERLQAAGLRIGDQMLPLLPWPEAGAQGLRRFEARSQDADLLPGSRIDARLVVFRSPEAVLLPRACLLNDDGRTATILALKEKGGGEMAAPPPAHQQEHAGPNPQKHGDQPAAHAKAQPAPDAGHHRKPQQVGEIEAIRVTLAAQGEEGAVADDAALAGRRVVCASPDILSRLVAGAPFTIQSGGE